MMPATVMNQPSTTNASNGGRLVTADGRELPLKSAQLTVEARGGVARVVLEQRFANPYADPLAVTYVMPLPADGAVSGYAFRIGDRRVIGEVDRKKAARERFEQAIALGRSAALLEQDRSSVFRQEIGNIPPHAEVVAELTIDQKLAWLDEGAWEWRFPTAVAPRYLGEEGRVADAARVTVDVADRPLPVTMSLSMGIADAIAAGRRAESPSHALHVASDGRIGLAAEAGARLDRDVVVRWPVAAARVGLQVATGRPHAGRPHADGAYGLVTIVPPAPGSEAARPIPRDVILLLDTSGSMGGEPLAQARRVVSAIVSTLDDRDRLEMIEFSNRPRRWKSKAVAATEANRREALAWITALEAGGGTEMRTGVLEALAPIGKEAQRQVVLVTDGLIGFESEVIASILDKLPRTCRLHTVGVGSAVNRSLTGPAARAGHGVEVVIGLGEDPERAARRLVARTNAPIVTELELSGTALLAAAPARLPDLFAGAPALLGVKLRPEGGELRVRGRTAFGSWEERIDVPACEPGAGTSAAVALFGREAVEDLEMKHATGARTGELDAAIEQIGLQFQIATRLTTWVAISLEETVDPQAPLRRESVPQELPHGMSAEGLGLRACAAPSPMQQTMSGRVARPMMMPVGAPAPSKRKSALGAVAQGVAGAVGGLIGAAGRMMGGGGGSGSDSEDEFEGGEALSEKADSVIAESRPPRPEEQERTKTIAIKDEAPRPPRAPEPRGAHRPARRLRGRITISKGGELVVEITVDGGALDWSPPADATLVWSDGSLVHAEVVTRKSTRAGAIAAGQTIRLTLTLPTHPAAGEPRSLRLGDLVIDL